MNKGNFDSSFVDNIKSIIFLAYLKVKRTLLNEAELI